MRDAPHDDVPACPPPPARAEATGRPAAPAWALLLSGALLAATLASPWPGAGARPAAAQIPGGARFDSLVTRPASPPERVEIDQVFLRFEHSDPRAPVKRTRARADSLARHVLALARAGADFDSLVLRYSDLKRGTRLTLVGPGLRPGAGERSRKAVEPAVADMAFGMSAGETGLVIPNNTTCRYGYYVIRRRS